MIHAHKPVYACLAVLGLLAAACTPAKTQSTQEEAPDAQFQAFFTRFKAAVSSNDLRKIADHINFPFYAYASKYSRADLLSEKKIDIFTKDVRDRILKSKPDNFELYRNKQEIESKQPDIVLIPENSPVVELDIINDRGGPAMRFMFAKSDSGYKLYCLVQ